MSNTLSPKCNFRVVIEPRSLGDFGFVRTSADFLYGRDAVGQARMRREQEDRANEIAADVRRHVGNVGDVSVEYDQPPVCEHCGADWTETTADYNGGCCGKDEDAEMQRQATGVEA